MLEAIESGASTEAALSERFDDLHLLRKLLVDGYVQQEALQRVQEAGGERYAVEGEPFYTVTVAGKAELMRSTR